MYSTEEKDNIFNSICNKISIECMPLRKVLKLEGMPSGETFYKWMSEDDSKSKQYARACEERSENIFEDILIIADSVKEDVIVDDNGETIINHNVIQRDRLRVDTRKWYLSKINPKKYSDKIQVDNTEFKEQPLFPDVPENDSNK